MNKFGKTGFHYLINKDLLPMSASIPVILPKNKVLRFFLRPLYSFVNFVKSSILSLLIIGIILGLTSEMDQAKTMLVAMLEPSSGDFFTQRLSLLICFIALSILAIGISHFPIYIYYAGNLNGSKDFISYTKETPYKKGPLSWIRVFRYQLRETIQLSGDLQKTYTKDWIVNILRNFLGLGIFSVWMWFILWTFEPNFIFYDTAVSAEFCRIFSIVLGAIPYLTFLLIRIQFRPNSEKSEPSESLLRFIGKTHMIFFILTIASTIYSVFLINFSQFGYFVLTITCFVTSMNYVFFRLSRPRILAVIRSLRKEKNKKQSLAYRLNGITLIFTYSEKYLGLFVVSFVVSCILVFYFTLASFLNLPLPNSLVIVFVFLYFYFYAFSIIFKYYFVKYSIARKEYEKNKRVLSLSTPFYKLLTGALILFGLLQIIGLATNFEKNENSLTLIDANSKSRLDINSFLDKKNALLKSNNSDTVYFVVSQGGGLKGNLWTLNVLDELNKRTNNKFIQNTLVFSGASGGTIGLSLYTDIFGSVDRSKISSTIDEIGKTDYVSRDVAMLFGIDIARSTFPWNLSESPQDRSYYNMLEYINIIHKSNYSNIPKVTYQEYWSELFEDSHYQLPILLVNAACTDGRRGIFCSVSDPNEFDSIFHFAHNLNQFNNHEGELKSIPFYEAVSTTNRFPLVAPVAKIEGVGHFMDAGAIDNSGILSAWDMYQFLRYKKDSEVLQNRVTVFVEITNGKTSFINHIMKEFHEKYGFKIITNEHETNSLVANINTGLNLDKIPGYLHEFLKGQDAFRSDFVHREICLPQKVSIEDVETTYFKGEIMNEVYRDSLIAFLKEINDGIITETEEQKIGFMENWKCYEPALSRHMSRSNLKYFASQRNNIYPQFLGKNDYLKAD